MAARSPVRSMAGPLVVRMLAQLVSHHGGERGLAQARRAENRMWSTTSPRARAASMRMASDSLTFVWPR